MAAVPRGDLLAVAMRLLVSPHDLSSMFSLLWPLLLAFTLPQLVFFRFYAWGIRHSFDQRD
jgi:hypothetical protein